MNTKKRMMMPEGGMLTEGEDPKDPGTRLSAKQIKQKYKGNPYVVNGRETWGESLDKTLPLSPGTTVRTAITNASKVAGVDPSLLYSSAMEEGLGYALSQPGYASEAYVNWETKNKDLAKKYQVDGFYNYGLDRFGEKGVVENLQKKGYLPKDFNNKYTVYDAFNEKKERIKTAAFLSDQDALTAKAAMLRDTQDQLNSYTTKKGYKLSPEQMDFFALAGYNGGVGNMQKMIDSYNQKGYLKDNKFLEADFKPASYAPIYTNVQRRLQNRNILKTEGYLEDGGEIDPGKKIGEGIISKVGESFIPKNPQKIAYDTFISEGVNSETAKILVAQMMHESKNFTSNVFKTDNNPMGMKVPKTRETLAIGPGKTKAPGKNGDIGSYAKFNSLEDAAKDLLLWHKANKIDINNYNTPELYSEVLRSKNYMGQTEQAKNIYIAGLRNNLKTIKLDDGGEIDPITGKPVGPTLNGATNKGIDVFGNAMNTPVPINPDAPKNEQIFKIDQTEGTPAAPPEKIIPLAQIAEQVSGKFGQQNINQTNQYVNSEGKVQTEEDRKNLYQAVTEGNIQSANQYEKKKRNIEFAASAGITAINGWFNKKEAAQQERKNLRKAIMQETFAPVLNPYLEGTGSQAIMKKGGKMRKWEDGAQVQQNSGLNILDGGKAEQISGPEQPMVEFKGKTHAEGGIGIEFGGKVAEIEHGEVGYVDNEDSLNIFGKMKVPGTNKSFKKAAKDMAAAQLKVDKKRGYYSQILNNSDNTDDYQNSAISTAKVMLKSLDNQAQQIKQDKEALASYQNLVLALAGKDENMMKYGGTMPKKADYVKGVDGLTLGPEDPASVQKIIDKYSGGKAPLKAEDFIEVSQKYGVPLDLMLAQAIVESNIGTKGRAVKTNNIFNVGNTDDGSNEYQKDWKAGLERYAKLIKDEYATDPNNITTQGILNNDFVRPKRGGRYATAKYTPQVTKILNEINPGANYTFSSTSNNAGGDPGDKVGTRRRPQRKPNESDEDYKKRVVYDPNAKDINGDPGAWINKDSKQQSSTTSTTNSDKLPERSNTPLDNSPTDYKPKYEQIVKIDGTKDTIYGPAQKDPTQFRDQVNIGTGDRKRGWLSPLAIEQIAPELLTVATNKRQAIPQLSYQPELKQTFDISYQLGRNENQSAFNQAAQIAEQTGNVDAISQLAAGLYKANEQYNMQEVQGNAQQKLGVYNQNIDTLNDAKFKNLQLIDTQQTKQAAADYNTWKTDIAAFTSVAGKELQNKLENKTYNAYANLFKHYGFDKKGNVTFNPDDVVTRFSEGEAQQFGYLAAQKGLKDIMEAGSKTATTYDKDGNIKKVSSIDDDINEFNSIWKIDNLDESLKRKALKGNKYAERIFGQ